MKAGHYHINLGANGFLILPPAYVGCRNYELWALPRNLPRLAPSNDGECFRQGSGGYF
jgi:hypothetical protein